MSLSKILVIYSIYAQVLINKKKQTKIRPLTYDEVNKVVKKITMVKDYNIYKKKLKWKLLFNEPIILLCCSTI